ncbi:hypothetical protein HNY73_001617 [Argiope bruennichi]|uniref:Uncharacterized protein n=1 Tax=Argiope bruennichi TaxID=94029 RepID=A0A8T0FV77_ARGBR|nr:hypothetical protein HNY73_001617 [Argiope bruennichi]
MLAIKPFAADGTQRTTTPQTIFPPLLFCSVSSATAAESETCKYPYANIRDRAMAGRCGQCVDRCGVCLRRRGLHQCLLGGVERAGRKRGRQ